MAAPGGVSLGLGVIVCLLAGISCQRFAPPDPGRRHIALYITGLDFESNAQISNDTSQVYKDAAAAVRGVFQPFGGYVDQIVFENGSPCVSAIVYWVDVDEVTFRTAMEAMEKAMIRLWNRTWIVSLDGCSPDLTVLAFNLYLTGTPWTDYMADHSSPVYMEIEQQIEADFAELGGQLRTLELGDNNGCIRVFVDWEAWQPEEIIELTSRVTNSGFTINNQTVSVSTRPCTTSDAAIDECPPVPKGTSGICIMGCDDDNPEMACEEGYKCCSNGCGRVCVRVGYKIRVTVYVVADGMLPPSVAESPLSSITTSVYNMVKELFNTAESSPVLSVEVSNLGNHMIMGRDSTQMNLNMYLSEDLSNNELKAGIHKIEGMTLTFGAAQIRIAHAEFFNHSLHDFRSCGGAMCHGICKHQTTGADYCSCGAGRLGPSCSVFDCRKDPFSEVAIGVQENHCVQGQCVVYPGENGECNCTEGYYGDQCDVNVCNMLNNACGSHGKCVGLVDQGKLCECDQGWSGIFCDVNSSDDMKMSNCNMERRLMQFVHQQVYSTSLSPKLNVFMSTLLKRMQADMYSIPFCWAEGSGKDGEYHSTCHYSSDTLMSVTCECLNSLKQPSGYTYFGPGDCRMFSSGVFWNRDYFHILNMTWTEDLLLDDSEIYMAIKDQIAGAATSLGGGVSIINFMRKEEGCVIAQVDWYSSSLADEGKLAEALEANGITVMGQRKRISRNDCTGDNTVREYVATFTFYVSGLPTSIDMYDNSSMVYRMAKMAVEAAFSNLGGKLRTLYLSESDHGCVMFFVEWESTSIFNSFTVMENLKANGLNSGSQTFPVKLRPCQADTSDNACPAVNPGSIGICAEMCGDTNPCQEGYNCCSNGCGHVCIRADFKVKVLAMVTVDMDMTMHEDLRNRSSPLYRAMKEGINMKIEETFNSSIVVSAELKGISGWRYQNRTYPLLNVELFLAEDIPNKRLRSSAYSLEKSMLPNVAGQPHILSVEFPNHSIHDVLACGGVECYGICKTRFSGGDFCSCWPGQIGSGCSIFDCRKDTTDFFPTQSFCQNGQCALDTMGQAFECDCNPGYYGDRCDVNVCDMSVNACGSHGKCAGLVEEGNLCFCEQGWGGIFCEKQTTEDNLMTTCEKERRLMLFVHGQVTGQVQRSSRFSTFMSVLLYRIESDRRYSVPFCSHSDPGSSMDRQYMSVCFYDSNTGNHVYCECVDENKKPNDMVHYGEGDCRDSTETFPKTEAFFIHHSNNASASALYVALSREIEMRLRGIGGRLKEIDLNTTGKGCTVVEVSWSSPLQTRVTVVDLLLNSRILVNEESVQISRDVCKTEANIDSCPTLLPNHMELIINCEDTCSEDEDCGEESKCCKSGCGAKTCTEVGFRDKITANITVDMEWNPQLGNASNIVYIATKTKIEANLDAEMRRRGLRSFISSKVLTFYPVELNQESATRAKRQAQIFLGIVIELKFNNTLPVESLLNAQSELEENGLPVEGQVYRLWRIQIGRIEEDLEMGEKFVRCGFHRCDSSSLCVESIGGIEYCACPEGRSGPSCSVMDCVTSEGSELCQNGGRCIRNGNDHNGGHCGCRAGFFGQFCQERFCDHLTDNACGLGRCLGIISTSAFCRCPRDRGGLFCELDRADPRTMTACKRSKRMFDYVVNLWKGLSNDTRIKDIDSFVNILGYMGHISVPHCWPEDSVKNGAFHSMCQYNMETKMIDSCHCLDDEGNQNYWDYDYETRQCRIYSGDCNGIVCHNGGSCISMPGEKGYCACPDGYHGLRCEIQKEVKCPGGAMPLMAGEEEFQCRMAPCPYGFQCNAHSADRWTACCFDEGFLCKTNPCQGGGSCVGNIMTGQVCDCPTGRGGMLCENFESDGEQTPCQISQRFKDAIIVTLTDGTSPLPGLSVENLRRILLHNKMEWIPQASCDVEGHYKSTTQAVHILNTATTKEVCLDTSGVPDPSCRAATCQLLSVNGEMTVCENGGRCVGDVRQKLCDCAGTGYHGFRCHLPGRSSNETTCTLGRDIAQYALSVLYDDDQPEILREQMNKVIDIHGDEDAGVFVPSCDVYGKFEFRGCVHPRQPEGTPTCYCATADGQIVGDKVSLMQLPEGCDGGKPHGNGTTEHCPAEWGKECIKPPWWCSHEVQCRKKERCSHLATPDGEIIECVPKETILPCDYQPCKDNPFAKCSPCGLHGKCYNAIMDHSPGRNKTMPSKSDEDDKEPGLMSNRPEGPTGSEGRTKAAVLRCSCSLGYSGEFCDVNTEVCGTVSEVLCEHGCMGDIDRGYLCRCPEGMAGIFCNKAVRSECERRKALFDDAIAIMTDEMTVEGYDNEQLKNLISLLVRLEGGDDIPKLNCTNTGLYAKIQCQYNLNSDSEWCYCANQQGEYISSNVQSYIDFDVCTANGDLRGLNEYYCHEDNPLGQSLCLNNGTCLFDVYNGHVCECPDGYSGAFCETLGDSTEARSLCEFMASAFDSLHVLNVQLAGQVSKSQMAAIMNITSSFIFPHKDNQYSVRPDCTQEGGFASSAVCYYNIRTKEKAACFCWGANGPDFYRPVAPGDDPFTKCASPMHCRDMIKEECPELKCMGGYRTDLSGCPVCECKHPCEDLHCKRGERCQMDPKKCHSNMAKEGKMDKDDMSKKCAMCVPIHKPGVCPDHNLNTYSSVLGGALGFSTTDEEDDSDGNDDKGDDNDSAMKEERTCRVSCRDDADCYGKKKCCGICGNRCIDPVETFTCSEEADKMNEYVVFLKEVEKALLQSQSQEEQREKLTLLDRISSVPHVWLPDCESDGHFFKPLQCEYLVDDLEDDQTPVPYRCFCVDRLGMRLPGTEGIDHNDPSACLNKPGACPYLTYGEEDGDNVMHTCASDVDCLGENKCCSDGVGMVCAPPSEKHMMATTDRLMSALCKINSTMCNGLCREDWESDGISCQCNKSSSYGPFCQQRLESGNVLPKTVCERKKLATSVFEGQFYEHETNPQGIVLLYQDYIRQMYEMVDGYDMEDEGFTMVKYECTSDGHFKPMQCIRDVLTWTDKACYCVDMNGTELIGTRKGIKEGLPHCGGDHQRMCPIGYPLHNSEGSMLKCGENVDGCPKGYACTRGAYGSQHCCLTRQGMRDVCHLPADVGMDCDAGMKGTGPGTRYFFDGKQCVSFNYKGCGGNKNHFRTKTACEERCKDKVHAGSCPARAFQVNVGKAAGTECKNHCREDKDCDATHKCCQSSCGRRCFPSISQSVERGMCPYGEPQQYCSPVVKCPAGHYCKNESIEGGICCAEYNNVNVCDLPPQHSRKCSESMPRFFYNATSMACEQFTYTGCAPQFNNFKSLEECCGACNGRGRCRPGKCPAVKPGTAISCQDECSADSSCPGKQICCSNGCAKMCALPHVDPVSDCWDRRNAALKRENVAKGSQSKHCNAVDIPECERSGNWSSQQCHKAFGLCWCVTPKGNFINNTMTHGPASCDSFTALEITRADQLQVDPATARLEVCPPSETLHCCPRSLCERSCRRYPRATCRINPCGGCNAEYFVDGQQVDCSEGLSKCEKELKEAATTLQEHQITIRSMKMAENDEGMYDEDSNDEEETPSYRPRSIQPGIPLRCQLPPSTGPCKGYSKRWYYNPTMGTCNMFVWGMCQGNQNRFDSPAECYNTCNEKADPCKNVTCSAGQECQHKYDKNCHSCAVTAICAVTISPNHASGVYIPRCEQDGDYNHMQCHDQYCWCVDENGDYLNGLTTEKLRLRCAANGMTADSVVKTEDCRNGHKPNISCIKECTRQVCPGNPEATCKVDLCSDNCAVTFVDEDHAEVDCQGNKCDVFKFDQEDREECSAKLECNGTTVRHCPESLCQNAQKSCSKNPCAVCNIDPCTCRPYFVDSITGERLSQDQCDYISLGVCQAKTCSLLNRRAAARLSGESATTSVPLPECDQEGNFIPKQCNGEDCVCVNEFGSPVGSPTDGTCQEIDEIVKVPVTLSFEGSLSDLNSEYKIQAFKNAILARLEEFGINPKNVRMGEPYEGSVKIDIEIIENPSSTQQRRQNIALASNALKQAVDSGNFDIEVDGQLFSLDPAETVVSPQTASQVGTGGGTTTSTSTTARPIDTDDDSGLTDTDKIIIGAVCGGVGLLVLIIICYCICSRNRKKETPPDDTYDHIRAGGDRDSNYDKPALYNPTFEDDGHYMKVRM